MYDEPVNLNAIQMTVRYGKEVYLEVDIMVNDITQLSIIIHCSHHLSSHWLKAYS